MYKETREHKFQAMGLSLLCSTVLSSYYTVCTLYNFSYIYNLPQIILPANFWFRERRITFTSQVREAAKKGCSLKAIKVLPLPPPRA